jgi:hypothetical protein
MNEWRVAIPSLSRVEQLGKKTLATLDYHGISKDKIDIFCIKEEIEEYRAAYPDYKFNVAPRGMIKVRNYISQEYYNEGDWFVSMDDDIEKIRMKNPRGWEDGWSEEEDIDLIKEIDLAFSECVKSSRSLWGIYPVENQFFMKNNISYDYKFIPGWLWGTIVKKDLLLVGSNCHDDYERSIRHYVCEGGMVRLNYLCCKTKYLQAEGGLGVDRDIDKSLAYLADKYPDLFTLKKTKKDIHPLLRDNRSG